MMSFIATDLSLNRPCSFLDMISSKVKVKPIHYLKELSKKFEVAGNINKCEESKTSLSSYPYGDHELMKSCVIMKTLVNGN